MKISILKVIICAKDIARFFNCYLESRSANSEDGKKISQAEWNKNMKNAYAILESIILMIKK